MLCAFKYGPWLVALDKVGPGEQGDQEACYYGNATYLEGSVFFELGLSDKAEKLLDRSVLDALKGDAEDWFGKRIPANDIKKFELLARVVRDFYRHEQEGGKASEWPKRHDLAPLATGRPVRGAGAAVLIDLGGDCYQAPPSKFLERTGKHASKRKR
ncbi:MAG: hypothetical protein IRY99_09605 [Isosphaeraceae bacterium]|nr:hypothetical protein [Isosphaeraceae bacterium]